jgi:hypothetical protein
MTSEILENSRHKPDAMFFAHNIYNYKIANLVQFDRASAAKDQVLIPIDK